MLDYPLVDLPTSIVGCVLCQEPAQQIPASIDGEAMLKASWSRSALIHAMFSTVPIVLVAGAG